MNLHSLWKAALSRPIMSSLVGVAVGTASSLSVAAIQNPQHHAPVNARYHLAEAGPGGGGGPSGGGGPQGGMGGGFDGRPQGTFGGNQGGSPAGGMGVGGDMGDRFNAGGGLRERMMPDGSRGGQNGNNPQGGMGGGDMGGGQGFRTGNSQPFPGGMNGGQNGNDQFGGMGGDKGSQNQGMNNGAQNGSDRFGQKPMPPAQQMPQGKQMQSAPSGQNNQQQMQGNDNQQQQMNAEQQQADQKKQQDEQDARQAEQEKRQEAEQKKQEERQLQMMKKGMEQAARGITQMKKYFDKLVAKGVTLPSDCSDALAKIQETIDTVKNATTFEEAQNADTDSMRDQFDTLNQCRQKVEMLAQLPRIFKQIDKEIKNIEREWTRAKRGTGSELQEVASEGDGIPQAIKDTRAKVVELAKNGDFEDIQSAIEDDVRGKFDDLRSVIDRMSAARNAKKFVAESTRRLRDAERTITVLKKQGDDTSELEALLAEAKQLATEIKGLKPGSNEFNDAVSKLADLGQQFAQSAGGQHQNDLFQNSGGNPNNAPPTLELPQL